MKWVRNKSSPSSCRTSIIARVFPVSWFSKFKQKGRDSENNSAKREKLDFSTPKERFYSMGGDEAFWRLSFGEERIKGRRSTGGINQLWYDDSGEEELQVPISSFKNLSLNEMEVPKGEDYRNFNDMVIEIKNRKDKQLKDKNLPEDGLLRRKKVDNVVEVTNLRRKYGRKSRCEVLGAWEAEVEPDDGADDSSKPVERVIFAIEPEITPQRKDDILNSPVSDSRKQHPTSPIDSKWKDLEQREYKEINVINEPRTKSAYIGREFDNRNVKPRNRVKAYSPRTECKIRALEEMRKARMRLKKKVVQEPSVFDSFAVVKSSFDPYQDFRDSMVEMIIEKRITSAEDLEELLACYLTLNRDEYHDLIVRVFRQVWFELNGDVC